MRPCINIAICEDDEQQLLINKYYIEQWATLREQNINILTYPNSEGFLFQWKYEEEFDIVFLDIHMGQMSGMELAKLIRNQDEKISIVFITGETKYVFEGYGVQALNYLMKPIKKEDVFQCLDIWLNKNKKQEGSCLVLKKGKEILKINYDDIYYFISFNHYLDIHTNQGIITLKKRISEVEKELSPQQFCRCHRSYIVNVKYIEKISRNELILDNGSKIPISKSRLDSTYELFMDYFSENS